MRALIAAVSLLALGSCNELITHTALFSRADAAKAAPFRSGVWRNLSSDPCKFDAKKPVAQWPGCAGGTVIVDGTFATYQGIKGPPVLTPVANMLVAGGTPMIMQWSPPAGAQPSDQMFGYAALRVTKQDEQGRVVAFTMWQINCGPPAPAQPSSNGQPGGDSSTPQLYPGLTQVKDSSDCTTDSQQAVRDAAVASETSESALTVVWVRDGDT